MNWLFWTLANLVVLIFTSLKSIRFPIDYASTQYLLSYQEGFIKRGLFGSVFFPGNETVTQTEIKVVALVIFSGLILALLGIIAQILRLQDGLGLLTVLFASSIAVVYMASTTGHFDHVLLLLAVVTVLPSNGATRLALTSVFGVIAILIHEAAALMVLPLMYFASYVALHGKGSARTLTRLLPVIAVHFLLTVYISFFALLNEAQIETLRESVIARVDFPLSDPVFEVILSTPVDEMQVTYRRLNIVAHLDSIFIIAPSLLPILFFLCAALRLMRADLFTWILAFAACLSPSGLRFFGYDTYRWDSVSVLASFLALYIVLKELPRPVRLGLERPWINPTLAFMIVVSASTTTFLISQEIRLYPFFELRSAMLNLFSWR